MTHSPWGSTSLARDLQKSITTLLFEMLSGALISSLKQNQRFVSFALSLMSAEVHSYANPWIHFYLVSWDKSTFWLPIKTRQFSIYKTCFDILVSSSLSQMNFSTVVHLNFESKLWLTLQNWFINVCLLHVASLKQNWQFSLNFLPREI